MSLRAVTYRPCRYFDCIRLDELKMMHSAKKLDVESGSRIVCQFNRRQLTVKGHGIHASVHLNQNKLQIQPVEIQ
jgi:hypothetical protein